MECIDMSITRKRAAARVGMATGGCRRNDSIVVWSWVVPKFNAFGVHSVTLSYRYEALQCE